MNIRKAEKKDFSIICSLVKNELGYLDLVDSKLTERLEFFNNSEDWATFVAEDENVVVGFIGIMKGLAYNVEGYYSQIMALAVSNRCCCMRRHQSL